MNNSLEQTEFIQILFRSISENKERTLNIKIKGKNNEIKLFQDTISILLLGKTEQQCLPDIPTELACIDYISWYR